jgi:hypothetical protein
MSIDTKATFGTKIGANLLVGAVLVFLGSIAVVLYQVYLWAKYGAWGHFSALDALKNLSSREGWPWLWSPSDWLGIHMVLEELPLSLGLMLIGSILVLLAVGIGAMVDEVAKSFARRSPTNGNSQE